MDLGRRIAELRRAAGWSQSRLAEEARRVSGRATVTKDEVKRWETGKRRPGPLWLPALATALRVPMEALTEPLPDPLRIAHEWLVSESPQTVESRSGRRVGEGLATRLEARVIELRHLDDHVGGEDLAPVVTRELKDTARLVRGASYSESTGRRLLTSVGELAQLAGWVASDAGHFRQAASLYLSGVSAATDAGDRALAANLFSSLSYQMANVGNAADGLLLARSAVKGADGTPTVRALLLERVAWSAAKAGETITALRMLDEVDDVYEGRVPGDEDPEWVYWLNRDEISTMRARVMVELGDPTSAEPLLIDVLSRYPEQAPRESSLYWSWLAEAYARSGEFDQARAALEKTTAFAAQVHSPRADERVRVVAEMIELPAT